MLAVNLRNPRELVQVLDFRAFGLEVYRAVFFAEGEARDASDVLDVAAQVAYEVPCGVVCLADNYEVKARFHFHGFERFCRSMSPHDGDLHVRKRFFNGVYHLEVVQDAWSASAAYDKSGVEYLDAFQSVRKVELHGGAVYELDVVPVGFDCACGIAQEHGPVKSRRLGHARTARLAAKHRMKRRI